MRSGRSHLPGGGEGDASAVDAVVAVEGGQTAASVGAGKQLHQLEGGRRNYQRWSACNPKDRKRFRGVSWWRSVMVDMVGAVRANSPNARILFVDCLAAYGDSLEAALQLQQNAGNVLSGPLAGVFYAAVETGENMPSVLSARREALLRAVVDNGGCVVPGHPVPPLCGGFDAKITSEKANILQDVNAACSVLEFGSDFCVQATDPADFARACGVVPDHFILELLQSANESFGPAKKDPDGDDDESNVTIETPIATSPTASAGTPAIATPSPMTPL